MSYLLISDWPCRSGRRVNFCTSDQRILARTEVCWKAMIRQILVFVLACAVLAAPLASEICEAACAGHHAGHGTSFAHHHHSSGTQASIAHQHQAPADSVHPPAPIALTSAAHPCAHVEAIVTESLRQMRTFAPIAAVANVAWVAVSMRSVSAIVIDGRHSPPAAIASIAPLRI